MKESKDLDCPKNIFIISTVSYSTSLKRALHFFQLQKQLENIGFTVVNPIEVLCTKKEMSYNYNVQNRLKKLINCGWVYIMPEVSLRNNHNIEVRICLELDMIIIQGEVLELYL